MRGRSISKIFWSLGIIVISKEWSSLLPRVVLNTGEEVEGKVLERVKEVEVEVLESSKSWLLSVSMGV